MIRSKGLEEHHSRGIDVKVGWGVEGGGLERHVVGFSLGRAASWYKSTKSKQLPVPCLARYDT